MMVDRYLALVVIVSLVAVPMISFIVDRMRSLPVDLVNASISIILLFVDSSMHFIDNATQQHVTADSLLTFFFVIVVGFAFTVLSIGIHMAIRDERKRLHIPPEDTGTKYIEFGYCISLLFSIVFLIYSCAVTAAVPTIFGDTNDTLFDTVDKIVSSFSNRRLLLSSVIALYGLFVLLRYWPSIDKRLRDCLNKKSPHR